MNPVAIQNTEFLQGLGRAVPNRLARPATAVAAAASIVVLLYLFDAYRALWLGYPHIQSGLIVSSYDTAGRLAMAVPAVLGYAVVMLCLFTVRQDGSHRRTATHTDWVVVVFLAYCTLTLLWSQNLQRSVTDILLMVFTISFAYACVSGLGRKRCLDLIHRLVVVLAVASLFLPVVLPEARAFDGHLRGLFVHKNLLGATASLGLLISTYMLLARSDRRWWGVFGAVSSAWILYDSGSVTSMVTGGVALAYLVIAHLMFRSGASVGHVLGLQVAFVLVAVAVAVPLAPSVLEWLGRDPTANSRTLIWAANLATLESVDGLLAGVGLNAFWSPGSLTHSRMNSMFRGLDQSHSGYVEIISEIGLIGFSLFLFLLVYLFVKSSMHAFLYRRPEGLLFASMIVLFAVKNVGEADFTRANHYQLFLLAMIVMAVNERRSSPDRLQPG